MKDIGQLMQQAQGMQQKLKDTQGRIEETVVEGTSGSGLVSLTLKGSGELIAVRINETLLKDGDAETLGDLIVAAHADAKTRVDQFAKAAMAEAMGPLAGLTGGLSGMKF